MLRPQAARVLASAVALAGVATTRLATAAEEPAPEPAAAAPQPAAPAPRTPYLPHTHQLGLALMPGDGYRMIVPYEENIPCGDNDQEGKRVCAQRSPFFLELQLSYGLTAGADLIADVRFGIEGEPITSRHQFVFAPGFRFWVDNDRPLKFYSTVQGVFDSTSQVNPRVSTNDFGLRNANGFMYDFIENVGVFVQLGETIGFKRWFRIDVDLGAGVQVRYP